MGMNEKRFGAFSSSIDPNKISETFLGVLKTAAGGLVFFGVLTIDEHTAILTSANQVVANAIAIAPLAYSAWNSSNIVFGIMQKAFVALYDKFNSRR